jgi:hypothetical protein
VFNVCVSVAGLAGLPLNTVPLIPTSPMSSILNLRAPSSGQHSVFRPLRLACTLEVHSPLTNTLIDLQSPLLAYALTLLNHYSHYPNLLP